MKRTLRTIGAALLLLTLNYLSSTALAQGTAFTYQGQLQSNGVQANGAYNLQFTLYTTNSGVGTVVGGPVTNNAVSVTNGVFTAKVDFGSAAWNGETNWLQIGVESNGTSGFTILSPFQQLTPVPYSIYAESANAAQLRGVLNLTTPEITSAGISILYTSNNVGNFFAGTGAGNSVNDAGSGNTAAGNGSLQRNKTGIENTAIGFESLFNNTNGSWNTANGNEALYFNTSGGANTADGYEALYYNISGADNTADGYQALYNNTNGINNTADGYQALYNNTIGSSDTACGYFALGDNMTGTANTAVGLEALGGSQNGSYNTAIGCDAMGNPSNSGNTATGFQALFSGGSGGNTADGSQALYDGGGWDNTAEGARALLLLLGGTNNIALGYEAGSAFTANESSNIDIGNVGVAGESGIIRVGTPGIQTATYLSGTVYANGVALTSDRNAKENFAPVSAQAVLDKVASLRVTKWNYKTDKNVEHIGPMAQDFNAAFGLNGTDEKHISVVDEGGVALTAIQGLNQKLEADNSELRQENTLLTKRLDELEAQVKALAQNNH